AMGRASLSLRGRSRGGRSAKRSIRRGSVRAGRGTTVASVALAMTDRLKSLTALAAGIAMLAVTSISQAAPTPGPTDTRTTQQKTGDAAAAAAKWLVGADGGPFNAEMSGGEKAESVAKGAF